MANATQRGEQLRAGLLQLRQRHEIIGDVRGLGLMVAMDLVRPNQPDDHDPQLRDAVVEAAFRRGLLLLGCGQSAIRFRPPLCITAAEMEKALELLDEVLAPMPAATLAGAS